MEYRRAGASNWTTGTGGTISSLAPGTYEARLKAEGSDFCGSARQITIAASHTYKITAEIAPDPSGADGKITTGYLLITFAHTYPANNSVPITGLAAATSNTEPGAWVTGDASAGTVDDNGDTDDKTWRVNISPTVNNGTANLSLNAWTAENGNTYEITGGAAWSGTVYKTVPEALPTADIDYTDELLKDLDPNGNSKINGAQRQADGSGYIPLAGFISSTGSTISIIKQGGAASVDSPAQQLTIPARLAAPVITADGETSAGADDGSITGVTTDMQYQKAGGAGWTTCLGTTIDNLEPGFYYYVRLAATGADFHSGSASAYIHAFHETNFGDVYQGYEPITAQEITGDGTIENVAWNNNGDTVNNNAFELSDAEPWTVAPKPGLEPGDYSAAIKLTYSDAPESIQNITFRVHKRAEIESVQQTGTDAKGATSRITITFANDINLNWADLTVSGGAVKSGTAFINSDLKTYILDVTPQMDHKNGDPIIVSVNLHSENFTGEYDYQASIPEDAALASSDMLTAAIPRAITEAKAVTHIGGYSTSYLQFTLDHAQNPIDTDAIEEENITFGSWSESVKITYSDNTEITPTSIARVDADMGYTFRVFIEPAKSGTVTISVPGFGIDEHSVTGEIVHGVNTFTDAAYFLNQNGNNYITDLEDSYQNLPALSFDPGNGLNVYQADDYKLYTDREYSDWSVEKIAVNGEELTAAGYETASELSRPFIFDYGTPSTIASQLQITLTKGWTETNGVNTIQIILKNGGDTALLIGKLTVSGITPTSQLNVENGEGTGKYPAGAQIQIQGTPPPANQAFVGWTQNESDIEQITLPAGINGAVTMPESAVNIKANFVTRGSAPAASVSCLTQTLNLADGLYAFNNGNPVTVTGGTYFIDETWIGTTLEIRRVDNVPGGYPITSADSMPTTLNIPARPAAAPTSPVGVAETFIGLNDGKITGVTTDMEYSPDGYTWEPIDGSVVQNLSPGTYYLRYKATSSQFASVNQEITIEEAEGNPAWAISLDQTAVTFTPSDYGHTPDPVAVTVTNTGNQPTGQLDIALSGTDSDSFQLSQTQLPSIEANGGSIFTIAPKTELNAGNYSAIITVSGDDALAVSYGQTFPAQNLTVDFTVNKATITGIAPIADIQAGTARRGAKNLSQITALLPTHVIANTTSGTAALPVSSWDDTDGYDPDTAQNYTFTATLDPAALALNCTNPAEFTQTTLRVTVSAYTGGGGGGGGTTTNASTNGSASSTETSSDVTADGGQIALDYQQTQTNVTINLPDDKTKQIIDKATNQTASIDISKITEAETVTFIPKTGLLNIADENIKITVIFPQGKATIDSDAVKSLIQQATAPEITIKIAQLQTTSPLTEQLPQGAKTYDISVYSGGTLIHSYQGQLTITAPYNGRLPVSVWYLDENSGKKEKLPSTYDNDTKQTSFNPPHLSLYAIGHEEWPFIDVTENQDWYFQSVKYVYENQLFAGTSADTFSPDLPMTRGMIATVLHRLAGSPAVRINQAFADVTENQYYHQAVNWGAQSGIISGIGDGQFAPETNITRQDLAALLIRYADLSAKQIPDTQQYVPFSDGDQIADYAKTAVETLCRGGVISGRPASSGSVFDPEGIATRAEVASMLHRFAEAGR
jgi:hypothetical protein